MKGKQMIRTLLATAVIGIGIATVAAQQNPIEARKALMKENGRYGYGVLPRMVRGQDPYDQAKVDAGFAVFIDTAQKLAPLWPADSKPVPPLGDYSSSPKIWENKADFEARLAKFARDAAEQRPKATSLDGLKAAFPVVRKNCDDCHDLYRVSHR
jgi:cytochrome c556